MNNDEKGPMNLGNPGEYSMAELAKEVRSGGVSLLKIKRKM